MRAARSSGIAPAARGSGSDPATTSSKASAPSTPSGADVGDDGLDARSGAGGGQRRPREAALGEEDGRLAVVEDVEELVLFGLRVDDHEDAAGEKRCVDRRRAACRVVHEDGHPVAPTDAEVLQAARQAKRAIEEVLVGEPLVPRHDRFAAGNAIHRSEQGLVK